MRRLIVLLPLIIGVSIAAGVLLGSRIGHKSNDDSDENSFGKIKAVLSYVQANYVDSVNAEKLTDLTLEEMLQHLDPHSDYFTAEETKAMNEPLKGNFDGIGIEYNFVRDTLVVMAVIPGGPSEKAGLQTGDRIVRANDTLIVGKNAGEDFIRKKLRGPKGTKVTVKIKRPTKVAMFDVSITRGSIPIHSVEGSYMLNGEVGYVKLNRFAETSYDEFVNACDSLLKLGMKKIVLDLRGNGGGYLSAATSIADEFLSKGKMIVYTKGRMDGEEKSLATDKGNLENMPLVILVDENSASASEILAGAIQDNDRGEIVGRRTFGKGLVQEEKQLNDGSAFRLTIARYYTPTGRCIQKPYDKGLAAYEADEQNRYKHGEFVNADSIKFPDSLKFKTPGGKIVYGGGGIMPDLFVPLDTSEGSKFLNDLFYKDIFTLWSLDYVQKNKGELLKLGLSKFRTNFVVSDAMVNELIAIGGKNGVEKNEAQLFRSIVLVRKYMKAAIARNVWGSAGYLQIWNQDDTFLHAALSTFKK
ncbi:MAG: S41 family peptidase [Bacteroidetes bacterium]|jgi:carboxyl-terminal processing protease|nr:S41 family peptidase [Bacteroidota bacterium]